ncbi:MAG: LPS assembly lipoprotein LptE [Gemmatimonadaceae bacterium]|nr:LPS assembly lipoprotein LptE [Gemmatimonadaceae bacterium]
MPSGVNRRAVLSTLLLAPVALTSGCLYGFAGGGLPREELQREVFEALRKAMQDRLNLRDATVERADVLVTGVIREYEVDLPVGVSADPAQATRAQRQLQLVVDYELVNQRTGELLKEKKGASRNEQYPEGGELRGRRNAIETMINELIDDMLSQW